MAYARVGQADCHVSLSPKESGGLSNRPRDWKETLWTVPILSSVPWASHLNVWLGRTLKSCQAETYSLTLCTGSCDPEL